MRKYLNKKGWILLLIIIIMIVISLLIIILFFLQRDIKEIDNNSRMINIEKDCGIIPPEYPSVLYFEYKPNFDFLEKNPKIKDSLSCITESINKCEPAKIKFINQGTSGIKGEYLQNWYFFVRGMKENKCLLNIEREDYQDGIECGYTEEQLNNLYKIGEEKDQPWLVGQLIKSFMFQKLFLDFSAKKVIDFKFEEFESVGFANVSSEEKITCEKYYYEKPEGDEYDIIFIDLFSCYERCPIINCPKPNCPYDPIKDEMSCDKKIVEDCMETHKFCRNRLMKEGDSCSTDIEVKEFKCGINNVPSFEKCIDRTCMSDCWDIFKKLYHEEKRPRNDIWEAYECVKYPKNSLKCKTMSHIYELIDGEIDLRWSDTYTKADCLNACWEGLI